MRLLLVEDDAMLGSSLKRGLAQAGHTVEWFKAAETAFEAVQTTEFDLLILDVNLPKISGIELVKKLRSQGDKFQKQPILMLTAMDSIAYKLQGLDSGADDYLTKPFDFDELLARIRALTRRAQGRVDAVLRAGDVEYNPHAKIVSKAGQPIILTAKELTVCSLLLERRNRIVNKTEIESTLYGWGQDVDSNTVEVAIYNLRKKLGKDFIETLRGVGYMVRE